MKQITGILKVVITVFPLLGMASVAMADSAHEPIHPGLTRLEFEMAKSPPADISAWDKDRNGEMGDASVTSDRYDVLHHDIVLRIDPETRAVQGSVRMLFSSRYEGLEEIVMDLRNTTTVDSVTSVWGNLVFSHEADSLAITYPSPMADGDVTAITVYYGGTPTPPIVNRGLMFRSHLPDVDVPQDQLVPIVASMSQPAYAQTWWPCKDKPGDKFTTTMTMTVPDTLVAVSNGIYISESPADPGWKTYRYREDYPIASYLVSVAISDYVLLHEDCTTPSGFVAFRNWVYPRDVLNAQEDFAPLCSMMNLSETLFGDYPFAGDTYGHAEFQWPGAMENQTMTSIGSGFLQGDGSRDWLIMHELAHQWFGDSLTPETWADIWLNEGFATYSEALWREDLYGWQAYLNYMDAARNETDWVREGPVYDPVPVFPGKVIYDKGAWILHTLRTRMGDAAFFSMLKEWASGPERSLDNVITQDFIDLSGQWAGEDLDEFFWPYLTSTRLPEVHLQYDLSEGVSGPNTLLEVTLTQIQSPLFDNVYPLEVTTDQGTETRMMSLTTPQAVASFEFGSPVQEVILDPDHLVLWRTASTSGPADGLEMIYPNPATEGYNVFRYWAEQGQAVRLRILDAMGRQVAERTFTAPDPGLNEFGWDLTGTGGARMPSGIYWGAMEIQGERSVLKFALVR